jgi:heme A synthase
MNSKLLIAGGCFIFILITGYILSRAGKPFNGLLLNIHKLIALGAFVYLIITIIHIHRLTPLSPLEMSACVVCGVFFVALIATGGIISAMKSAPEVVHKIHQILPYLVILSTGITLYHLPVSKIIK